MNHDSIELWLALVIAISLWLVYVVQRFRDEGHRLDNYHAHVARHSVFTEGCEHCTLDDQVCEAERDARANEPDESANEESADVGASGFIHARSVADTQARLLDDLQRYGYPETHHATMDEIHAERLGRRA